MNNRKTHIPSHCRYFLLYKMFCLFTVIKQTERIKPKDFGTTSSLTIKHTDTHWCYFYVRLCRPKEKRKIVWMNATENCAVDYWWFLIYVYVLLLIYYYYYYFTLKWNHLPIFISSHSKTYTFIQHLSFLASIFDKSRIFFVPLVSMLYSFYHGNNNVSFLT